MVITRPMLDRAIGALELGMLTYGRSVPDPVKTSAQTFLQSLKEWRKSMTGS